MKQQQKELLREILASARIDLSEKCKDVTKTILGSNNRT